MGVLIIAALLGVPLALLFFMWRWLARNRASRAVWIALGGTGVLGVLLGLWLSLVFEYQSVTKSGMQRRTVGAPLPVVIFQLEEGQWIDYPVPLPAVILIATINIAIASTALAAPVFLSSVLRRKLSHSEA